MNDRSGFQVRHRGLENCGVLIFFLTDYFIFYMLIMDRFFRTIKYTGLRWRRIVIISEVYKSMQC